MKTHCFLTVALAAGSIMFSGCADRPGGVGSADRDRDAFAGTQSYTGFLLDADCAEVRNTTAEPLVGTEPRPRTGEQAGTAHPTVPAADMQRFQQCAATRDTNNFAIYADGRVHRVDDASNSMIREHLQTQMPAQADRDRAQQKAEALHVQVTARTEDGRLHVDSIDRLDIQQPAGQQQTPQQQGQQPRY